jgi:hypothetical protein
MGVIYWKMQTPRGGGSLLLLFGGKIKKGRIKGKMEIRMKTKRKQLLKGQNVLNRKRNVKRCMKCKIYFCGGGWSFSCLE